MNPPLPANQLNTLGTKWRYNSGELHAAFDYAVPIGTPVLAVRRGVVLDCNDGVANNAPGKNPGSGAPSNWVLLGISYKGKPASVLLQHLSPGLDVRTGERVTVGQRLGESGNTGNSTGAHLHVATMWGHRDTATRFDYLDDIDASEGPPRGTASNQICIYPPSRVFGRSRPSPWASGHVVMDRLRFETVDSDSVRRLQHRLNEISLNGGTELKITGKYRRPTRAEVTKWQIQKDGAEPGSHDADGILSLSQARRLFGEKYTIQD